MGIIEWFAKRKARKAYSARLKRIEKIRASIESYGYCPDCGEPLVSVPDWDAGGCYRYDDCRPCREKREERERLGRKDNADKLRCLLTATQRERP